MLKQAKVSKAQPPVKNAQKKVKKMKRYTALLKDSDHLFASEKLKEPFLVEVYDHYVNRVIFKIWGRDTERLISRAIDAYGQREFNETIDKRTKPDEAVNSFV